MKKFMEEKNFTYTLPDIPESFTNLFGGRHIDSDIDLTFKFIAEKDNGIKISILLNKYPAMIPFWSIFYVKIQDQEDKFFLVNENKGKRIQKSFNSILTKNLFISNTTITYKIIQLPSYICTLKNEGCVCYLNCGIQLLFHLSKFRSLLFGVTANIDSKSWLYELINLFSTMCIYKNTITTEKLTESFGWPSVARFIQHDVAEIIQIILEKIRSNSELNLMKKKEKFFNEFDNIFYSQIFNENQLILNLSENDEKRSLKQMIESDWKDSPFQKFPEVLFLRTRNLISDELQIDLDLGQFSNVKKEGQKHSHYILSGIVLREQVKGEIYHFKCFVRTSVEEVWHYFSDSVQTHYSFQYSNKLKKIINPFDTQIKPKLNKGEVFLLMYIAKDVIGEYFTFTPAVSQIRYTEPKIEICKKPTREIKITTLEDIKKYVESGHADFEDVETSVEFEIQADMTFGDVYKKVSDLFDKPIGSFVLRTEGQTKSPSFHEFPNNLNTLSNFQSFSIHLYYDDVNKKSDSFGQYVPFYFLLFNFNANNYSHQIGANITHSISDFLFKSAGPKHQPKAKKNAIGRTVSAFISKKPKRMNERESESKSKSDENSFKFLTCLNLNTKEKFESILNQLIEIINQKDTSKKHSKINLYTAEYDSKGKQKIGYKKIVTSSPINSIIPQLRDGIYIYVQCEDDFTECLQSDQKVQSKFLFYKYMHKTFNSEIYPKEIKNVFSVTNFFVPVTFCQINNPEIGSKTMLFPTTIFTRNIENLKKLVCVIMNEKYPGENGLMQFFIGFRSEKWPPFHDPLFSDYSLTSIFSILSNSLKYGEVKQRLLNYSTSSSEDPFRISQANNNDDDDDEEENDDDDDKEIVTDNEYISNVYIHYSIFDSYDSNKEISLRVYFSEDSITVKFVAQVKLPKESKVDDLARSLRSIFGSKLSKEDNEVLKKFEDNEIKDLNDHYRILQTSNGIISREIELKNVLRSNMEVRFERIPKKYSKDKLDFNIPVFYGARYNPKNDSEYGTNYIAPLGTPFYFPVLKSDLNDPNIQDEKCFKKSNLNKRLKSMIIVKENYYKLFVVNFSGTIQDVGVNDLDTIKKRKLLYSICIRNMNALLFIDERKFFTDELRIIR